jgi:hypothetical protein
MIRPDINNLCANARQIVEGIERESLDVYLFLKEQFNSGPILQNYLFQFVYRSFYRLDNAGLTPEFKTEYFKLMEECRSSNCFDLTTIAKHLYEIQNRKKQKTLQFSFITKLANTINDDYPLYDSEVAKIFSFNAPYTYKPMEERLTAYLDFYDNLKNYYHELLNGNVCAPIFASFQETYPNDILSRIPRLKLLDFFFWSAGKKILKDKAI